MPSAMMAKVAPPSPRWWVCVWIHAPSAAVTGTDASVQIPAPMSQGIDVPPAGVERPRRAAPRHTNRFCSAVARAGNDEFSVDRVTSKPKRAPEIDVPPQRTCCQRPKGLKGRPSATARARRIFERERKGIAIGNGELDI